MGKTTSTEEPLFMKSNSAFDKPVLFNKRLLNLASNLLKSKRY